MDRRSFLGTALGALAAKVMGLRAVARRVPKGWKPYIILTQEVSIEELKRLYRMPVDVETTIPVHAEHCDTAEGKYHVSYYRLEGAAPETGCAFWMPGKCPHEVLRPQLTTLARLRMECPDAAHYLRCQFEGHREAGYFQNA